MNCNLKIKCITYNVADRSADEVKPEQMLSFLKKSNFDLVFVGLQEVVNDATWTSLLKNNFRKYDYILFKVRNIWAIWLYGFVRRSQVQYLDCIESETTASGYAGLLGNKGGVSIRTRFHSTNLVVVNAHFTAHEDNVKERLNDYLDILSDQSFRDPDVHRILDHDYVFWMGDLNFRIDTLNKEDIESFIQQKKFNKLWPHDQLIQSMKQHNIFQDFIEGPLKFAPTFKFDDHCDVYDTSKKQRKPAWTDRILALVHRDDKDSKHELKIERYYSETEDRGSDHRAVCAEFVLSFNVLYLTQLPIQFQPINGAWNGEKDEIVYMVLRNDNDDEQGQKASNVLANIAASVTEIGISQKKDNDNLDKRNDLPSTSTLKIDNWDWVALLPADWSICEEDLITYSYVQEVSSSSATNVAATKATGKVLMAEFPRKSLNSIISWDSKLQLVYFSRIKNCIQGYSQMFTSKRC